MVISSLVGNLFPRRRSLFRARNSNRGYYAGGGGFLGLLLTGLSLYRFLRNRRAARAY